MDEEDGRRDPTTVTTSTSSGSSKSRSKRTLTHATAAAALARVSYDKISLTDDDNNDDNVSGERLEKPTKSFVGLLSRRHNHPGQHEDDSEDELDTDHNNNINHQDETEGFLSSASVTNRGKTTVSKRLSKPLDTTSHSSSSSSNSSSRWYNRTLFPDHTINITLFNEQWPLFDSGGNDDPSNTTQFTVKLLKFIILTFVLITTIHIVVGSIFDDRDKTLTVWHIWMFDSDLIVRDCIVFFVVGRMWKQQGVDHIAFIGTAILANIYFESQNYMWFLQHSLTLYEMHCTWPWELWIFVMVLIPTIGAVVVAHIIYAYQRRILIMKVIEMVLCVIFFMAPMMTSKYFHLHHWYGGWLLGMHCNFDTWWSKLAMAYCFGMYCNGIAVYGRDPVLTCEYAYFLTTDQNCPYVDCYLEALRHPKNDTDHPPVKEMIPVDWRNCSSTDYIP